MTVRKQEVQELLTSQFVSTLTVEASDDNFICMLPFTDFLGEPIELSISFTENYLMIDDLGRSAGALFSAGQHTSDSAAHQLIRNLSDAYNINMDYNNGLLRQEIPVEEIHLKLNDFIKVLISIQTVIPELQRKRRVPRGRTKLSARIGRDIRQLKLPVYVHRQTEVEGKHDSWTVDFKYGRKIGKNIEEVLIVAPDLNVKEPRKHAEHALALAIDLLAIDDHRALKVIYSLNEESRQSPIHRAAMLINDSQNLIGYTAFDYANIEQKSQFMASTIQDLTPLSSSAN